MLEGQAHVACVGEALSKKLRHEVVVKTEDEMGGGVENGPSAAQQTGHVKRASTGRSCIMLAWGTAGQREGCFETFKQVESDSSNVEQVHAGCRLKRK